jgi:hypothetical protein
MTFNIGKFLSTAPELPIIGVRQANVEHDDIQTVLTDQIECLVGTPCSAKVLSIRRILSPPIFLMDSCHRSINSNGVKNSHERFSLFLLKIDGKYRVWTV